MKNCEISSSTVVEIDSLKEFLKEISEDSGAEAVGAAVPVAAWQPKPPMLAWVGGSSSELNGDSSSSLPIPPAPFSADSSVESASVVRRVFDPRDASLWNEQRGDPLPAVLHRRLTTATFSFPPPALPCSPFARPFHGLRQALRRPPWHAATMQALVKRVRRQGAVLFEFWLELPRYKLFLMAARKLRRSTTTYFVLSLENELDAMARDSPHYLGKLRASDVGGVDWVLYDHGLSRRDSAVTGRDSSAGAEQHARRVLLALSFEHGTAFPRSLSGSGSGPPRLLALIPGGRAAPRAQNDARSDDDLSEETSGMEQIDYAVYRGACEADGPLLERWRRHELPHVLPLTNKPPVWNEELHSYTLDYEGRAAQPSVKNVQLIEHVAPPTAATESATASSIDGATSSSSGGGGVGGGGARGARHGAGTAETAPDTAPMFQMGKLNGNLFTVDWTTPLSPMAAFAIALAITETPWQLAVAFRRTFDSSRRDNNRGSENTRQTP